MKDIEQLLTKNNAKPRRNLKTDFTQNIINHLDDHPHHTRISAIKEFLSMKYYTKPVIAIFVVIILTAASGTAYAAVGGWAGIQALFGGQKKVDSARVVRVDTQNCTITSAFNITSKDKQQDAYYYKIKDSSRLTNEQVVQMVRGYCELGQVNQTGFNLETELNKNPLNKDRVVAGFIDSEVTAISSSSISIKSRIPLDDEVRTYDQTFSHIDPQVIVYDGIKRLSLSDIKVGDHVSVSYRLTPEARANYSDSGEPEDGNDEILVAIHKNSKDFTAAINYKKYNGKEFEQVIPCTEDKTGYCTIEQYHTK